MSSSQTRLIDPDHDPHRWLEEVESAEALDWVHRRNAVAEAELADAEFEPLREDLREILDASDRIPGVVRRGEHLYNFWTDAEHPQGIWRRTTPASYRTEEPDWEILLDLDALSAGEGVTWVWHGADVLRPAADEPWRHALVSLSPGGSDADVTREFDLLERRFVPEADGGFVRGQGKGSLSWIDGDTVYATVDRMPAAPEATAEATAEAADADVADAPDPAMVTSSGYPRAVRRWRRGTPLSAAEEVISVESDHLTAGAGHLDTPGFERDVAVRALGFHDHETHLLTADGPRRIEVPTDVRVGVHRDLLLFMPRTSFTAGGVTVPGGGLAVADVDGFLAGETAPTVLFAPDASTSLQAVTTTRTMLVLTLMEDVVHRVEAFWRGEAGAWTSTPVFAEVSGSLSLGAVDEADSDEVWLTAADHLRPTTLHLGDLSALPDGGSETLEVLKQAPERFDATGLTSVRRFATSDDGTRVPYFLIGPAEVLDPADGTTPEPAPTLLSGYGGFQVSRTPSYLPLTGKGWLERGGVFAVACIRGGGEYGPDWHRAALRENRHRAYEDFAAVARELVDVGVTTVPQLACRGGSNGGLLTGMMLATRPELFGAVVIQVPLLDMKRYSHLLAGASWRAEYGDPDTEDWEFIQTFSPYHLLGEGDELPPVLLTTSTRDDRVHPGHARKMTAALESIGADVRYWENTEGGHGGAASPAQQATLEALIQRFLDQQLRGGAAQ